MVKDKPSGDLTADEPVEEAVGVVMLPQEVDLSVARGGLGADPEPAAVRPKRWGDDFNLINESSHPGLAEVRLLPQDASSYRFREDVQTLMPLVEPDVVPDD